MPAARQLFPFLVFLLMAASTALVTAQTGVTGRIVDEVSLEPIPGVEVRLAETSVGVVTNEDGQFTLEGDVPDLFTLVFTAEEVVLEREFERNGQTTALGNIGINTATAQVIANQIFTIQIDEEEDEFSGGDNVSGLLTASRDVFQSTIAFVFGPMRFRLRGYDSENSQLMFNGVPFNDMEVGYVYWSTWGGLNDITRNREAHIGLEHAPFAFGGVGGIGCS